MSTTATDVLMVLENNTYPRDARVRLEAETLAESGRSVEVLAPRQRDRPARETLGGVRVWRFPLIDGGGRLAGTALEYAIAMAAVTAAVLPRLARSRAGVLHVHNPPDMFFPLMWLARARGWRTVFDHHDDAAGMLRDKLGRPTPAERVLTWMRNRSARAADVTITTNDTQRELVEAHARAVAVVRNCPPAWFASHRAAAPTGRLRLVFLGEIGKQDRVERAVEIVAALRERRHDAELLVIGDGPERGAVEARAGQLGLGDRVSVTGWVPYEQVPQLLASAHVGLDTAPPTEVNNGSTMVKVREYLVVGLPVVATPLRETIVSGGGAVTMPAQDTVEAFAAAVCELVEDRGAWLDQAARARSRGMELLWPTQAQRLLDVYAAFDRA